MKKKLIVLLFPQGLAYEDEKEGMIRMMNLTANFSTDALDGVNSYIFLYSNIKLGKKSMRFLSLFSLETWVHIFCTANSVA